MCASCIVLRLRWLAAEGGERESEWEHAHALHGEAQETGLPAEHTALLHLCGNISVSSRISARWSIFFLLRLILRRSASRHVFYTTSRHSLWTNRRICRYFPASRCLSGGGDCA